MMPLLIARRPEAEARARAAALLGELGLAERGTPPAGRAVRGRAAAGGGGPRAGPVAAGAAGRRADRQPRPGDGGATARPAAASQPEKGAHRRGGHPQRARWPAPATGRSGCATAGSHPVEGPERPMAVLQLGLESRAGGGMAALRKTLPGDMFERYTERARRVIFFARYEASQLGSKLHRDRAPAAGPDPRGQGPDLAPLQQEPPVDGVDPQGDRGPRPLPRQGLDLRRHPALARRASACWASPPKRRSGCSTTTSAPSTSCWA